MYLTFCGKPLEIQCCYFWNLVTGRTRLEMYTMKRWICTNFCMPYRFLIPHSSFSLSQAYYKHVNSLKKEENEKYSIRCTQLYTLSLANTLSRGPFWQCYNLDFRGRVYPVAPHFSQMLGDPARGEYTGQIACLYSGSWLVVVTT